MAQDELINMPLTTECSEESRDFRTFLRITHRKDKIQYLKNVLISTGPISEDSMPSDDDIGKFVDDITTWDTHIEELKLPLTGYLSDHYARYVFNGVGRLLSFRMYED